MRHCTLHIRVSLSPGQAHAGDFAHLFTDLSVVVSDYRLSKSARHGSDLTAAICCLQSLDSALIDDQLSKAVNNLDLA